MACRRSARPPPGQSWETLRFSASWFRSSMSRRPSASFTAGLPRRSHRWAFPTRFFWSTTAAETPRPSSSASLQQADRNVAAIHLSRNFGHQAAVSAGIDHARGRAVIVMDGDLQDPPEVLPLFVARWREGFEVVYAIRQDRKEGLHQAAWVLFVLPDPGGDQRDRHPAGQRRFLPDGPTSR